MKEIKLIRLEMENFKCFRHLRLDFNGRNAVISGDNATGKTTVYDSLMWLLFSKNSNGDGDKNFEVKPLNASGEVADHDALTAVEAVFSVNGEELTLRRTYREKWETKRGSVEAVYTGNTSEYYIDSVPVKRNAFQDKVNELVDEDTFRLLTNTSHFPAGISWQDRRAVLFKVAGVLDDMHILGGNEQFQPLIEGMGKLSLEDYKKKLLAEKRKFVGAKTEIPARISECQKTIEDIEQIDFTGAKAEVKALQAKQDSISAQIVAIEHDSAADQKQMEIREAKLELSKLEMENKLYRESQIAGGPNINALNMSLTAMQSQLSRRKKELGNEEAYIGSLDRAIEESRQRWHSVNGEQFATKKVCPTCGQNLPAEQVQKALDAENARKQKRLSEILEAANTYKESKAQAADRVERMQEEIRQLEAEIQKKKQEIAGAERNVVAPKDMEHYAENAHAIQVRIDQLNDELYEMMQASADVLGKLRSEKSAIIGRIASQNALISKESLLEYSKQRIEQLREDAQNGAAALEAIEKMLFLMDEYSRYKTRFVEDSINGCFRIARFRLFREQANGGIEDRCDVVHEGIPYENVNNGMKINLGIDIINTLSTAYGVKVPLFVDNAESVTKLEGSASQIIRLVVSENDKELRVSYEN